MSFQRKIINRIHIRTKLLPEETFKRVESRKELFKGGNSQSVRRNHNLRLFKKSQILTALFYQPFKQFFSSYDTFRLRHTGAFIFYTEKPFIR